MEKKLDLRVQKTYKALLKALYDLLCEKSFDDITVTELCDRAETRKATFYKHFGDKRELLTFMIKEMQRISKEGNQLVYDVRQPQSYYVGVFRYFLNFLDENEKFTRQILTSNASPVVIDLLSEQMEADLRSHMKEDMARGIELPVEANMLAVSYTGAMVYCGCWWICQNKPLDKEIVIAHFSRLIMKM